MKRCSCGRPIKQKYYKLCIYCQKKRRRRRRETRRLVKELRMIRRSRAKDWRDSLLEKVIQ